MAEPHYAVLIRHGAYHQRSGVPSARQPFPLTEDGQAHARRCAVLLDRLLKEQGLAVPPVIHASHQLRAWQTASEIAQGLGQLGHPLVPVASTSALAERGLGSAANLTIAEIEAILREDPRFDAPPQGWKSDSDYRLPLEGAESLMEAGARVARHMQSVATMTAPEHLAIHVGHGASFRHACHHLGILTRQDIARFSMQHAQPLLFCYDAHGRWRHLSGEWKIRGQREEPID